MLDPEPFEAKRVSVRGVSIQVRVSGTGPLFIWGHGLLMSMAQEDDVGVFEPLRRGSGVRWVRYDARGHGESEATYDPEDYRWPALARDVLELMTQLGAARAMLGGVSMGCATSLYAAQIDPQRVSGLVLMAPPAAWSTRPRQALMYRVASGVVGTVGLGAFRLISSLPSVFSSDDSVMARMRRALVDHLARADERAVAAALQGAARSDLSADEEIARLDVPTLILAWRGDPVHPVSTARRLADLMPRAELSIASNLGEIRQWPERLREFFKESTSSRF